MSDQKKSSGESFAGNVMKYSVATYLGFAITGLALIVKGLLPAEVLGAPVTFMTYTATIMNIGILGLDQDLQVDVDQRKIQQALLNILSNAYKYSPAGGPVGLTLLNESASEPSRVGVQFTDHGLGMRPDQLARVFERFYRRHQQGAGSGLGLAIVGEICRAHLAHISLHDARRGG